MRFYRVRVLASVIFVLCFCACLGDVLTHETVNYSTGIAKETDSRLLLFSTLDGTLVAIDQQTGNVQWRSKDKPTVTVPLDVTDAIIPLFLPDPRDGSLYLLGNGKELLKKMPFTIPQLVASSPCRSSDGILYTGKKKDTWFMLDPNTGQKRQILGFEKNSPTCPIEDSSGVYIGRTQYSIMMIDSRNPQRKWNVTFYDYTASPMDKDELQNYDLAHFASTSTGRIVAMDRRRGSMLWDIDLGSPVVSVYILDAEGLLSLPFTSMANHTIAHLATQLLTHQQPFPYQPTHMKLYPTVYIGQHMYGLYALPSLVDQNMVTITSSEVGPLLLEGPDAPKCPQPYPVYVFPGRNYHLSEDANNPDSVTFQSVSTSNYTIIYLGHYNTPEYTSGRLFISGQNIVNTKLITDESLETKEPPKIAVEEEKDEIVGKETVTIGIQVDPIEDLDTIAMLPHKIMEGTYGVFRDVKRWINQQENKGLKITLIILIGCIIAMFWYLQMQVREFQLSQNGSRGKVGSVGRNGPITALAEELPNGMVQVGKITFNPEQLLGKGCEGTFVYRGEFDKRQVAVKRLLPECFTFADREVALLRESDAHPNVIRYFCTEQDRMFRYIALELCQFTVHDYVSGKCDVNIIPPLSILKQATAGLAHLHSLDIVHRDVKPHNVLLSMPNSRGEIRAMISDFGLCKKLQVGRVSFSHRSGITGTDGWIAPEMLSGNERTTCAVDMFSLGCLFYYVLSEGDHPFGDVLRRQANILGDESDLNNLKGSSWQVALQKPLLAALISPRPQDRPPCTAVLMHSMFWSSAKILAFFQDVSDRIEKADVDDVVLRTLEQGATFVVRRDWHQHIHMEIATDLRKYRSYRGDSIRDLLRALRNKKHHYRDLTPEAQKLLGETADSFTDYWTSRFPLLLVHTWLSMQIVANETTFVNYYHYNHRYSLCNYKDKEGLLYPIYKDDFSETDLNNLPERFLSYNKNLQKPQKATFFGDQHFRKYKQNTNNYMRNYVSEENVGDTNHNNVGLYRNNNPKFAQNQSPKYKKRYNGSVSYADMCADDGKSINSDDATHHVHFADNDWEVNAKYRQGAKNKKSSKVNEEPLKWVITPDKKKI